MWKNGKVCSAPGCGALGSGGAVIPATIRATPPPKRLFIRLVTWLRCVAIAPFGFPVVPEV